jgi:phosphoribosylformimino-5-aminoimidazole carboxamide ribotide isomerase
MLVIPVIDLMGGLVVRGVAGRRNEYRPIKSRIANDAQPATVAHAFAEQFGFDIAYVADLDAITNGRPNVAAWKEIAAVGLKLWLDAGVGNSEVARKLTDQIDAANIDVRLVIGLESLESQDELASIVEACGHQWPIFSLDMKNGQPLVRNPPWRDSSPLILARMAMAAGIQDLIVLDLADVGTSGGARTLDLCREIRGLPAIGNLIAGGGVRGLEDLRAIATAGCDAALVASALHDGRLTSEDLRHAKNLRR